MIKKAITRAYDILEARNWDTVYWAIDLHGVCLKSNYQNGGYTFENDDVLKGLRAISERPESKIILWSSCHKAEQPAIIAFMAEHGVTVHYFNENPEVEDTSTGNFTDKFYFSILLDDKAGFDPETDWKEIIQTLLWMPCISSQVNL